MKYTRRARRFTFCAVLAGFVLAGFVLAGFLCPTGLRADTPAPAPVVAAAALPPALQPSPIPLGSDLLAGGALDLRTRTATTGRNRGLWIEDAELDFQHPITRKGVPQGNIVVQVIGENPPDLHRAGDVQLGEAYLLYKLPLHSDTGTTTFLKAGQFQLPFALLATYDPHLDIVQPLYAQSLGLRTDWGVALTGSFYGYLQYDLSLTTGTGPNHADVDPNRLVTFRLGRTFTTRNGLFTVGGSLLSGRLPVTDPDPLNPYAVELPPSGRSRPYRQNPEGETYASKTRIAGDGTFAYHSVSAKGEALIGADGDNRVLGYFAEGDYRFSRRAHVLLARSLFVYPLGKSNASREYVGATYDAGRLLSFSAVYEYLRDVPRDASGQVRHRVTIQALLRF